MARGLFGRLSFETGIRDPEFPGKTLTAFAAVWMFDALAVEGPQEFLAWDRLRTALAVFDRRDQSHHCARTPSSTGSTARDSKS